VDLVVLCGYLHILTAPMLAAYPGRILNVHDADLTLTGPDGAPKYRGLHSTRDAILAGERETRTSVHLVTEEVDQGPVIARSAAYPVSPQAAVLLSRLAREPGPEAPDGPLHALKTIAWQQREWMMATCWGPLLSLAIERVITARPGAAGWAAGPELEPGIAASASAGVGG
jgi:hypothetical protein